MQWRIARNFNWGPRLPSPFLLFPLCPFPSCSLPFTSPRSSCALPFLSRSRGLGLGCGEKVSPSPQGEGSEERAVPPPQKIFDILESKWRIFVDSLVLNCAFLYDENSKKYTRNAWSAMEIDLYAIKSVVYCLLLLTFTQT